jgi:trans-aconitate methyltransferase
MADSQTWNADDYEQHAPFVAELGVPVIDLLTVAPPARVLDLGCGDGVLTQKLCERGYTVLGVDASAAMVHAASARGVPAQVVDGHALPFVDAFEAVFSNAALHWLLRPDEAIAGVHRALRANGQFVGEFGGAGNVERLVSALVAGLDARGVHGADVIPWYFPSAGEYATRLERAGFRVDFISHFDRPTPLPSDLLDWIATFGESFTRALPERERADYLSEVRARLAPQLVGPDGRWLLDYVRLRFRATRAH